MAYEKTNWTTTTPLSVQNLNKIEEGIYDIDNKEFGVLNQESTSTTEAYSCDYINKLNTYSSEETVIGTWFGKPLYSKTISFNTAYSTQYEFAHGIENYDELWLDISKSFYSTSNGISLPLISTSYYTDFAQKTNAMIYQNNVILYSTGGWDDSWKKTITINYTKTTD